MAPPTPVTARAAEGQVLNPAGQDTDGEVDDGTRGQMHRAEQPGLRGNRR